VGAEFAVGGIELATGDTLVAFTDGATEGKVRIVVAAGPAEVPYPSRSSPM
jgi:serine phosphatase RsbU (regulator of sigma subunit)